MAIWQNWCFSQFYQSQLLTLVILATFSFIRENLRGWVRENLKQKIQTIVIFLSHVHFLLHQMQKYARGHDSSRIHHWVVRLIWKTKMICILFCFENCSDLLFKNCKFSGFSIKLPHVLRSLEQFNWYSKQFWNRISSHL